MERDIRNAYDFEPLIQFGVLPEELSLCLSELRMILIRVNLKNLAGHARGWWIRRRIWVTWRSRSAAPRQPRGSFVSNRR